MALVIKRIRSRGLAFKTVGYKAPWYRAGKSIQRLALMHFVSRAHGPMYNTPGTHTPDTATRGQDDKAEMINKNDPKRPSE